MAAGTERSFGFAADHGFGLMLSTLPAFSTLAGQVAYYREKIAAAPSSPRDNPARGRVDIARWVYVAESDEQARADTEHGIIRHLRAFQGAGTAGYLGSVSEKGRETQLDYGDLSGSTIIHGSPETVIQRIKALREATGLDSLLLHYPPYYGTDKVKNMLRLFAREVIPEFR